MSYKWNVFCELGELVDIRTELERHGLAVNTASKTFVYTMPL